MIYTRLNFLKFWDASHIFLNLFNNEELLIADPQDLLNSDLVDGDYLGVRDLVTCNHFYACAINIEVFNILEVWHLRIISVEWCIWVLLCNHLQSRVLVWLHARILCNRLNFFVFYEGLV